VRRNRSIKKGLGSISSTFYVRLFLQNQIAQLSLVTFQLCNFWRQNFVQKRACKTLMKLTPGVNLINVSMSIFAYPKSAQQTVKLSAFWDLGVQKLVVKH